MADNVFEILIKYGVDKAKVPEAIAELNKLKTAGKEATKEVADGTEKANVKTQDLKKSVQLVGHEFGALGRLAHFALNPIVAGFAALAIGIGKFKDEWTAWFNAARANAVNAAHGVGDIKKSLEELETARIKADEAHKTSLENLDRETNRKITALKDEQKAVEELTTARERAELAGAKTEDERRAISKRYAGFRSGLSEETLAKEIAIREGAMGTVAAGLAERGREADKDSRGLSPNQVNAKLQDLPKILKSLDEQIAEQKKITEDIEPGFWQTLGFMFRGKQGAEELFASYQAADSSRAATDKLKSSRAFYERLEQPFLRAQVADSAVTSGLKRLDTEGEALTDLKSTAARRKRFEFLVSNTEAGSGANLDLINDAAAGADAIRAGGRATGNQASAINQLMKTLGMQNANMEQVIQMFSRMNDTIENQRRALRNLESRVNHNQTSP